MIPITLWQIAELFDLGDLKQDLPDQQITSIVIDSKKVQHGCLFIAIKGQHFDGHDFILEAVQRGAIAVVATKKQPTDLVQFIVPDTTRALGQLGAWMRAQISAKVIALTGSSGKTSVKEMVLCILQTVGNVLATKGNFNNEIGVPLTLLELTGKEQFAVFELGASHIGEISYTSSLVRPDIALVNNIAAAHLEGFGSLAGVAQAKGEIFSALAQHGCAVINADSCDERGWRKSLITKKVWRFSLLSNNVDFFATNIKTKAQGTCFDLHTPEGQLQVNLPLYGSHNIANALAATALAVAAGVPLKNVRQGLSMMAPVKGRLFPIQLGKNKLLLDDTYNANMSSMYAAIKTLEQLPGYRIMVVGEMAELGRESIKLHQEIGEAFKNANIDTVYSVGGHSQYMSSMSGKGQHFADKAALVSHLFKQISSLSEVSILVKGSRSAAMEQVVQCLQEAI